MKKQKSVTFQKMKHQDTFWDCTVPLAKRKFNLSHRCSPLRPPRPLWRGRSWGRSTSHPPRIHCKEDDDSNGEGKGREGILVGVGVVAVVPFGVSLRCERSIKGIKTGEHMTHRDPRSRAGSSQTPTRQTKTPTNQITPQDRVESANQEKGKSSSGSTS